jgi:hypothetical protein
VSARLWRQISSCDHFKPSPIFSNTSLNLVPNAQLCVYLTVHITNYISKTSLYTTFRMYSSGPWLLKILMFAPLVAVI